MCGGDELRVCRTGVLRLLPGDVADMLGVLTKVSSTTPSSGLMIKWFYIKSHNVYELQKGKIIPIYEQSAKLREKLLLIINL